MEDIISEVSIRGLLSPFGLSGKYDVRDDSSPTLTDVIDFHGMPLPMSPQGF